MFGGLYSGYGVGNRTVNFHNSRDDANLISRTETFFRNESSDSVCCSLEYFCLFVHWLLIGFHFRCPVILCPVICFIQLNRIKPISIIKGQVLKAISAILIYCLLFSFSSNRSLH